MKDINEITLREALDIVLSTNNATYDCSDDLLDALIDALMLQLSLNPNPNDVSILEFRDIISHSNNYEIATLISNKYKCNCF